MRATREDEPVDRGPATSHPGAFAVSLYAPGASSVDAVLDDATVVELHRERSRDDWVGEVPVGSRYLLLLDGDRPVLDPRATQVWFPPGH